MRLPLIAFALVASALLSGSPAAAPGGKLGFADFWSIAGLTHDDTAETVVKK